MEGEVGHRAGREAVVASAWIYSGEEGEKERRQIEEEDTHEGIRWACSENERCDRPNARPVDRSKRFPINKVRLASIWKP